MIKKKFNKPNLNAPRYRPTKLNLSNKPFYDAFIKEHPKYAETLSVEQFKNVIKTFNGKIWEEVVNTRDGVELPEQLGYLFIGTCPKRQKESVDYDLSCKYGIRLENQNWESDHYLAKIFYTNFETKYSFKNHDLWGFTALRDFKRTVAKTYPTEWKKYVMIDNLFRISRLFRRQKLDILEKVEAENLLDYYNEFNLEDPWQHIPSTMSYPEYVTKSKQ